MKIGFLNNQFDNRGTGNAVYDYAHYNEELLGNKSVIYSFRHGNHDNKAVMRFHDRFSDIRILEDFRTIHDTDIDFLYHIKSGQDDGFRPNGIPYGVHAVFEYQPHGDKFVAISEWLGSKWNTPFVPHIISLPEITSDYRALLQIPEDATVFGRHGAWDTFDISWAWDAIKDVVHERSDVWFLFLNTREYFKHPRVRYFPSTANMEAKKSFINTCDAMIHARSRGETFGISVGEFASQGKPIITYGKSHERAHIYELRGTALTYNSQEELFEILKRFKHGQKTHPFYNQYTPEKVIKQFKEVFLGENSGN